MTDARRKLAMGGGEGAAPVAQEIDGIKYLGRSVSGIDMKDLKPLADEAKQSVGSGVVAIVGVAADGKAGVVVGVTPDLNRAFRCGRARAGGRGPRLAAKAAAAAAISPRPAARTVTAAEAALEAVGQALREKAGVD